MSPAAVPAGFLHRCAAWSLDAATVALATLALCWPRIEAGAARIAHAFDAIARAMAQAMVDLLMHGAPPLELARQWLADPQQRAMVTALSDAIGATLWPPLLVFVLLAFAWFVAFEASPRQATPGKRALGLRVVGAGDARIGIAQAARRHAAGTLSWLTLNIGHLLAVVPPQRQALHDRIAGTRVVQAADTDPLPAWAVLWLGLQALAVVAALVWLFIAANAAMERAFDALL